MAMTAMRNGWLWFLGAVAMALAGCRSPESMLSSTATSSTEEMAAAIDASLREADGISPVEHGDESAVARRTSGARGAGESREGCENEDGPSIVEQARAASVEPFAPPGLSPISPAQQMSASEIPPGYQARIAELERLGEQLAAAAKAVDADFRFDVVYNPKRADTCHTDNGHILVTSALIEKLKTRNQLAVALALEMAEHIRELEQKRRTTESVQGLANSIELTTSVVVNDQSVAPEPVTPDQIHRTASELLTRAGYSSVDLAAVQHDIQGLLADQGASSEIRERSANPSWAGPQPPAAN